MLHLDQSKMFRTEQFKLAADATIAAEGKAGVIVYENGQAVVKPSTGAANEVFAGVLFSSKTPLDTMPNKLSLTAVARKVTLPHDPIPGTVGVEGYELGDPATAAKFSITGREITLPVGDATKTVVVTYTFSPSVMQARTLQGDVEPGFALSSVMRSTGVIQGGTVVTSEFDTDADWTPGSLPVRLGADGKFTTQGNGTVVGGVVTQYPVAGVPRLGITFNV